MHYIILDNLSKFRTNLTTFGAVIAKNHPGAA